MPFNKFQKNVKYLKIYQIARKRLKYIFLLRADLVFGTGLGLWKPNRQHHLAVLAHPFDSQAQNPLPSGSRTYIVSSSK